MSVSIIDKKKCCGCTACYNICPVHCISMEVNREGFLYPVVNNEQCIECRMCEKSCIAIGDNEVTNELLTSYAALNKNNAERKNSSSGGIFILLAEKVISAGGVVFGAAMSEDNRAVHHIEIDNMDEISRMMGSKYLQSSLEDVLTKIKSELEKGRTVLFTGTPCQINGLKKYLIKPYDNLILVDIICHGVPSPQVWKSYTNYIENRYCSTIKEVSFRYKKTCLEKIGIKPLYNGDREVFIANSKNSFMRMFLKNYCLRESCYQCVSKLIKGSDITLGDFWGVEESAPEMSDGMGTSIVFVRTEKGMALFESIKEFVKEKEVTYQSAVKHNWAEYKSVPRPVQRDVFFKDLELLPFSQMEKKYTPKPTLRKKIVTFTETVIYNTKLMIRGESMHNEYCMRIVFKNKNDLKNFRR